MVRVLTGVEAGVRTAFMMPDNNAQLKRLRDLALGSYPMIDPHVKVVGRSKDGEPQYGPRADWAESDELKYAKSFRAAFWAAGQLGRLPGPEPERRAVGQRTISWWASYCEDILRQSGHDVDVPGHVFAAAALAHNDIPHTITNRWPFDVVFGLTIGTGIPATDRWRRLLDGTARVLAPTPLPASQLPPLPSQVLITQPWRD